MPLQQARVSKHTFLYICARALQNPSGKGAKICKLALSSKEINQNQSAGVGRGWAET